MEGWWEQRGVRRGQGLNPRQTYLKFSLEFVFRESDKQRFAQRRKASKSINSRFTQMGTEKNYSRILPQRRRGRRELIFCLSGDDDKQKHSSN